MTEARLAVFFLLHIQKIIDKYEGISFIKMDWPIWLKNVWLLLASHVFFCKQRILTGILVEMQEKHSKKIVQK